MAIAFFGNIFVRITPLAAGAGNTDHVLTRPLVIVGMKSVNTAAQAGGTMQISRQILSVGAFFTVTDAVICAVLDASTEAAVLTQAQTSFAIGDTLRLILAGAVTNGVALVQAYGGVIPGGT